MRQGKTGYKKWVSILVLMLLVALTSFMVVGCSGGETEQKAGESTEKEATENTGEKAEESHGEEELSAQRKAQLESLKDEENVSELYTLNCGACHGHNGGGVIGPSIKGTALTVEQIQKKIEEGNPPEMPKFKGGELSDEQIKALAAYVKNELK